MFIGKQTWIVRKAGVTNADIVACTVALPIALPIALREGKRVPRDRPVLLLKRRRKSLFFATSYVMTCQHSRGIQG